MLSARRIGAIAIVWWVAAAPVCASTIAIVRTNYAVALAADSVETIAMTGRQDTRRLGCKIFRVRDVFFAIGGLEWDTKSDFDTAGLVSRVLRLKLPVIDAVKLLEATISPAFIAAADLDKNLPSVISVFVGAIENGKPVFANINFVIKRNGSNLDATVTRHSCPGDRDCPLKGGQVTMVGAKDLALARLREGTLQLHTPAQLAEALVRSEVEANIVGVGGPIDVVQLRPGTPPWIHAKPGCPVDLTEEATTAQ